VLLQLRAAAVFGAVKVRKGVRVTAFLTKSEVLAVPDKDVGFDVYVAYPAVQASHRPHLLSTDALSAETLQLKSLPVPNVIVS
jgi:hypothetical protein